MAKPQRAEFYLDDVADGRLRRAWLSAVPVPYGLAFALGIVDGWFRGLVMLVVCGSVYLLWMAWQTRRARRLGIRLDRHGLLEFRWGHLPRRIRWEDILDVELRPDGATLRTTGDDLLIDAQTWNWRRLTDRVVERLGLARPAELDAPQMSPRPLGPGPRPDRTIVRSLTNFITGSSGRYSARLLVK